MSSHTPGSSSARAPPPSVSDPTVRRPFALPARIASKSPSPSPAPATGTDGIETLFVCASTKITSFTASGPTRPASPSRRRSPRRGVTTPPLPSTSATDRTLAVGPLRIYRVTSSNVSFLNSGSLLHTIFPRSQCWCVNGESVFVLRIRQDTYYRIQLPHETTEDRQRVDDFRNVLGQVLQYEKTRCPFKRGFEVELPARPKTPPRKHHPPKLTEKVKKWTFDKTWMPRSGSRPCTPVTEGSDAGTVSSYEEDDNSSICTDRSDVAPSSPATLLEATPPKPAPVPVLRLSISERAKMFQGTRSVTTPLVHRPHRLSTSSEAIPEEVPQMNGTEEEREQASSVVKPHLTRKESTDAQSILSTVDSFYSCATSTQSSASSPFQDAEDDSVIPWAGELTTAGGEKRGRSKHRRHTSEITVRQPSEHSANEAPRTPTDDQSFATPSIEFHMSSPPSTPPLVSDSDEDNLSLPSLDIGTPPDAIRMRRLTGATQKRAFSPMPLPQNLFLPPANSMGKQFTSALLRKTTEIVLGPPAHLVSLMLRIAAKISDGVFRFSTYRIRNNAETIPGSWLSEDEGVGWDDEDDFGIPLRTLDESVSRRKGFVDHIE